MQSHTRRIPSNQKNEICNDPVQKNGAYFSITLYLRGTGWPSGRPTSQPTPAHRAWLRAKQNEYLQLHTKREKKDQLLRILQKKS